MIPALIVGGVVIAAMGGISFMLYRAYHAEHIDWLHLPNCPGTVYFTKTKIDVLFLAAAFLKAKSCMVAHTKWSVDELNKMFINAQIYVEATEVWREPGNSAPLAGAQANDRLIIGPSLQALLHEMEHYAQKQLDNIYDSQHTTWDAYGFTAAGIDYHAWLDAKPRTP